MTAYIPDNIWSLPAAARQLTAPRSQAVAELHDPRVNEALALRCCAQYRNAFRCAAVSYPADVLRFEESAEWIRRHGVAVVVDDIDGLSLALAAGVVPERIIMHTSDLAVDAMARAVEAGVGRNVITSLAQAGILTGAAAHRRRVLVDVTDVPAADTDRLVATVIAGGGLDLIGVHRRLCSDDDGWVAVRAVIAAMRGISQRHRIIPARLSLGDVDAADWGCASTDLPAIAGALDDAVEDGCIVGRFPSPAVNVSPSCMTLMPYGGPRAG